MGKKQLALLIFVLVYGTVSVKQTVAHIPGTRYKTVQSMLNALVAKGLLIAVKSGAQLYYQITDAGREEARLTRKLCAHCLNLETIRELYR